MKARVPISYTQLLLLATHLSPPLKKVHFFPSPNLLQKVALSESVPVGVIMVQSKLLTHLIPSNEQVAR